MSAIVELNPLAMSGVYVIYGNAGGLYEKEGKGSRVPVPCLALPKICKYSN